LGQVGAPGEELDIHNRHGQGQSQPLSGYDSVQLAAAHNLHQQLDLPTTCTSTLEVLQ
jgi:hypothetical protein